MSRLETEKVAEVKQALLSDYRDVLDAVYAVDLHQRPDVVECWSVFVIHLLAMGRSWSPDEYRLSVMQVEYLREQLKPVFELPFQVDPELNMRRDRVYFKWGWGEVPNPRKTVMVLRRYGLDGNGSEALEVLSEKFGVSISTVKTHVSKELSSFSAIYINRGGSYRIGNLVKDLFDM